MWRVGCYNRGVRGWIKWFTQGLKKRRRPIVLWTLLTVVVVGAAFARTYDWKGRPERTINDPAFARAAIAICEKSIPKLRAVRREDETEKDLERETAKQVEGVADRLEAMVDRLKTLEVRASDQPEVDAWFVDFGEYVAAGRHYAEAVRGGDENVYNKVDDEGVEPLKRVRDFALANRIDACIP